MMDNIPANVRAELVKQLVTAGCDSTVAHETVDLMAHAINEAVETVTKVIRRGSSPQVVMAAHSLAFQLLGTVAKVHADVVRVAAERTAAIMGIKTVIIGGKDED